MLYKSGYNLESSALQFIDENDSITLFSAYIKLEELKFLNQSKKITQIIVRWEIRDLCLGVSDIELYQYCLENDITLFRNTRIHLKAFWNNAQAVLFGSANVTGRGIGEKGNYNYELNGLNEDINFEDVAYFNKIIINSEYVTSGLYRQIEKLVKETDLPTLIYPTLDTSKNQDDYFLLSNLPMTESVEKLYQGYYNPENLDIEDVGYVAHDIALYNIPSNLNQINFYNYLQSVFNSHPFINNLKEHIKNLPEQSLRYGGVVRWIQENTTTVPTPRSWELKKDLIVNILFDWICCFDKNFSWSRPNYSQVIRYESEYYSNRLKESIENLRRDQARGFVAPHQLILLMTICRHYQTTKESQVSLINLKDMFHEIWIENEQAFRSENPDIVMPIKALKRSGLISADIDQNLLKRIRTYSDLNNSITNIEISKPLAELFKKLNAAEDIIKSYF
jgi:hypothetical protein